jgi:hypothetical protein
VNGRPLTSLAGTEADAVVARLRELRIVPVATASAERSAELGEILLRAGLPCLEVTFRNADALDAIEEAAGVEGLLVGAGTILSAKQVEQPCFPCRMPRLQLHLFLEGNLGNARPARTPWIRRIGRILRLSAGPNPGPTARRLMRRPQ